MELGGRLGRGGGCIVVWRRRSGMLAGGPGELGGGVFGILLGKGEHRGVSERGRHISRARADSSSHEASPGSVFQRSIPASPASSFGLFGWQTRPLTARNIEMAAFGIPENMYERQQIVQFDKNRHTTTTTTFTPAQMQQTTLVGAHPTAPAAVAAAAAWASTAG